MTGFALSRLRRSPRQRVPDTAPIQRHAVPLGNARQTRPQ
jgi:hypothetical protein